MPGQDPVQESPLADHLPGVDIDVDSFPLSLRLRLTNDDPGMGKGEAFPLRS